jgi:hypothetical protein
MAWSRSVVSISAAIVLGLGGAAAAAELLPEQGPEGPGRFRQGVQSARTNEILELFPGLTKVVKPKREVRAVAVGNPNLVDATMINLNSIAVSGKGIGTTNLLLFDAQGAQISNYRIQVVRAVDFEGGEDVEERRQVSTIYSRLEPGSQRWIWEYRWYTCASNCSEMNDTPPIVSNPPTGSPPSSTTTTTSNVNSNVSYSGLPNQIQTSVSTSPPPAGPSR